MKANEGHFHVRTSFLKIIYGNVLNLQQSLSCVPQPPNKHDLQYNNNIKVRIPCHLTTLEPKTLPKCKMILHLYALCFCLNTFYSTAKSKRFYVTQARNNNEIPKAGCGDQYHCQVCTLEVELAANSRLAERLGIVQLSDYQVKLAHARTYMALNSTLYLVH